MLTYVCGSVLQPDRADELDRINAAGGRVIYWDGARVLGVLAMSRAIGKHLNPSFYTRRITAKSPVLYDRIYVSSLLSFR